MCIIVDANAAHRMHAEDPAGAIVLRWLLKGKGRLVVSKELLKELSKTAFRDTIAVLDRAARVCRADEVKCQEIRDKLEKDGDMKSNDGHVLAIVLSESCDLVFTHDNPLHIDLKNKKLVPNGCSIFQTSDHGHLLGECNC
jgi:rRNA-processing protein FCF1